MRREPDFFGDEELVLVYIAKRLEEALALEDLLTRAEIDYVVEADHYKGGVIFMRERVGAFFYVLPEAETRVRETMAGGGYKPFDS